MPQRVRRSARNSGSKIASPQFKHDLFEDPPDTKRTNKKTQPKIKVSFGKVPEEEKVVDPIEDSDNEEATVGTSSHPSKNYKKVVLYDKWKAVSKSASTYKKSITALQKDAVKQCKEMDKLYRQVCSLEETNEKLEDRVEELQEQLFDAKNQLVAKKGKEKKVSDTERIANMKATYKNLTEQKEYEHKSLICDLQLKYSEMELKFNSKLDYIARLEEEVKTLKKNSANLNDLKVASLRSEIQIRPMEDKVLVR